MLEQKQQLYGFDNFRLDVSNRQLLDDGRPVALPAKAFDMLVVLIENGGRLIGKDELFSRVWPDQIVEESNLTVQVSAIRKALGEHKDNLRYIVTVPGHGYRFTGDVISLDEEEEEVVIERHSRSGLVIESSQEQADAVENALIKNFGVQNVDHLTTRDGVAASTRPGAVGWRTLLLTGLIMIVISLGVIFMLKRSASTGKSASVAPIKSIAVLPFKPLVAASRDESLELGMAEALITRLSSLREISVRPTTAVRKYNGLDQDAVAAGRQLQVESVLDGSLQRAGDRLRVTVRLLRVADGQTLWTEQFDENFTNIFAVQDRVSEKIVGLLALKLTGQEQTLLTKRYTQNSGAYELYLKGGYFSTTTGQEDRLKKGIEYFKQAIVLDPNYAAAYIGLASAYTTLGGVLGFRPPGENLPKAKAAVMKALEIDETLADAHALLASYKLKYEWNWPEAERELKRALELDPNNAAAHDAYGTYFQSMGRFDEALAERKLAQKFDPVSPSSVANVGYPLYYARRYDEAIGHFQRALELNPNYSWGHLWVGQAYVQKGMYEEAIAEINKAITLSGGNIRALATLGHAFAAAGKRDEAQKVLVELEQLSKQTYVSPYFMAVVYSGLEEKDQAFHRLEQAYQERHAYMVLLKVEPVFDPLRSDPRFAGLMRRVGLPS
jgi:DNA-binding winged helix-turn-helix (wHTH) protein/TolB-like protein/Flp pilus assembly protein TadD